MSFGGPDYTRVLDKALKNVVLLDPVTGLPLGATTNPLTVTSIPGAPTAASDVTATGALGALNAAVTISTKGLSTATVDIATGTLVGTVIYEATLDDTNWINLVGLKENVSVGGWRSTDTVFGLQLVFDVAGYSQFRVRCSAYTSGTSTVIVRGSVAPHMVRVAPSLFVHSTAIDADANTVSKMVTMNAGTNALEVYPYAYQGLTWDRVRTPNIFKTASVTASGDNAVWTPTAGKKFRLMRFLIQVTQDASLAAGADLVIALRDATTALNLTVSVFVPTLAGTVLGAGYTSGWIDLGNGPLSAVANNVLNANLSAALTAGVVRIIAAGTEE